MAGLEGAPSAVESHLHRGEGQVGHEIFTALHVAVLHLEEKAQIRKEYRKRIHHSGQKGSSGSSVACEEILHV